MNPGLEESEAKLERKVQTRPGEESLEGQPGGSYL